MELGVPLNASQIAMFVKYLSALQTWNKKINLTSIKDPEEICVKHFLDSLTCVKTINLYKNVQLNKKNTISIIDIGTGAGFPGIPLKIALPSLKLTLLDSHRKKIEFLKELVNDLNIKEVEIIKNRAEIIGQDKNFRSSFNIVISRAVAPLSILSEYSLPLVKKNGWFIAQKGKEYEDELNNGSKAIELLGGLLIKIETICLPFLNQERNILIIKKIKDTPDKYPRRNGIPRKRPLNN